MHSKQLNVPKKNTWCIHIALNACNVCNRANERTPDRTRCTTKVSRCRQTCQPECLLAAHVPTRNLVVGTCANKFFVDVRKRQQAQNIQFVWMSDRIQKWSQTSKRSIETSLFLNFFVILNAPPTFKKNWMFWACWRILTFTNFLLAHAPPTKNLVGTCAANTQNMLSRWPPTNSLGHTFAIGRELSSRQDSTWHLSTDAQIGYRAEPM